MINPIFIGIKTYKNMLKLYELSVNILQTFYTLYYKVLMRGNFL